MKQKDGWAKNMQKFKFEYRQLKYMADGKPKDWLKAPWNSHHYVDMFVEAERASPYLMGHIWAVYFPVSIAIMVFLGVTT